MVNGWYKSDSVNGVYYTHSGANKSLYRPVGPGDRRPTPDEMVKAMTERSEASFECQGFVTYESIENTPRSEPVELPPGAYIHMASSHFSDLPERLVLATLRNDEYVRIPSAYDPIATELREFLKDEKIYRDLGCIYKRGVLMYGPPGNGKTSLIREILRNEMPEDAIAIFFETIPTTDFINRLRETTTQRLKIFVFEELVTLVESAKVERVLDFLDGEKSIDRSFMFATTNYPEKLPGNIVDRRSRWDLVTRIDHPKAADRKMLLRHYLQREPTEDDIQATKDLAAASIKEACFLVHRKGQTVRAAAKAMADHSKLVKSDFAKPKKMGIGIGSDDDDDFDL